jgi:predicted metalloprotease
MRLSGRRQSANVEDRRGARPGRMALGGGIGAIIVVVAALLFGVDPGALLNLEPTTTQQVPEGSTVGDPHEEEQKSFVSGVLATTEDVWSELFVRNGGTYAQPTVVLFTGLVESACGRASAASGPFYCPADQKVYLDLSFFDELHSRFGAPGDFAAAYVIAHEIGHHVQKQMGITDQVDAARGRVSEEEYNRMSVRLELQADFFAGVWAYHAKNSLDVLEAGDYEEGINAASAIGDDRLQKQSQGYVVPDAFTHGTSTQRVAWFRRGFETGDLAQGDTFNIAYEDL